MSDIPKIIERLVPGVNRQYGEGSAALRQHLLRYRFASAYLRKGDEVLDIACGSGYGAAILAASGAKVTAVDRSIDAISYAKNSYGEAITWLCSPFDQYRGEDDYFDRIVCLETLEHLEDPQMVLQTFARMLKKKGLLLCSVPIIPSRHFDPYHLHDFSQKSFLLLLDLCGFRIIDRLVQEDMFITVVACTNDAPDLEPEPVFTQLVL